MPRNASGTYTLPIGAFAPQGLIKSSDHNSNYSDIATALTQSLATTGVSSMSGQLKAAAGAVNAPSYAFSGDLGTGLFLAGSHQIGWAANGVQGATFNSDTSVTWAGNQSIGGTLGVTGAATLAVTTINGTTTLNATTFTFGVGAANAFFAGLAAETDVEVAFDGGGSVLTAKKIFVRVPAAMTINTWSIMGDQSGSVTIDILRANAGVPSASIVGAGTKPNLSSAQDSIDNAPSSWTSVSLAKDDWLAFSITGTPSGVTFLTIALNCTRTAA